MQNLGGKQSVLWAIEKESMGPISPSRAGAHNPEPANRPVKAFSQTGLFLDTF